jgi:hypothetical protein
MSYIAPLRHYFCETFGVEKNRYGYLMTSMPNLEILTFVITAGSSNPNLNFHSQNTIQLELALRHAGVFETFRDGVLGETHLYGMGSGDGRVMNMYLKQYFQCETSPVPESFFDNWPIPLELLAINAIGEADLEKLKAGLVEVRYTQTSPIPRQVLQRLKIDEETLNGLFAKYNMSLLEVPFL